ncbi:MAG: hypothetical protein ABH848_06595 [Candidatus Omnitrophota bacterium]
MKKLSLFIVCLIFSFSIFHIGVLHAGTYDKSAEYLIEYAKEFYEKGNKPEAIHEFRKALVVDPINREAISYLEKLGVDVTDYRKRAEEYEKRMGIYKDEEKEKKAAVSTKQDKPVTKKKVVKKATPAKKITKSKAERFLSEDELKDEVIKELSDKFIDLEDRLKQALGDRDALLRELEDMKERSKDEVRELEHAKALKDAQAEKLKKQLADSREALDSLSDDYDSLSDELKNLRKIKGYPDIRIFDADVKIKITPTIKDDKSVLLKISPTTAVTSDYKDFPSIITKDDQRTINIKSGDSIMLTGLRCNENDKHTYRVPLSSKLVLLGQLFEKDAVSSSKKKISVTITPEISK